MKMLNVLITIGLCLVKGVPGQEDDCSGPCAPFDQILEGAKYYSKCNFPTHLFNASCLLSSCPSLRNVCPFTSNRTINQTALSRAVSTLNACIRQNSLICNYNMSYSLMTPISFTTAQLIPCGIANGTVVLKSGTVENFSKATFTSKQCANRNGPLITLTIQMPNFRGIGYYNSTFDIAPTSILRSLRGLIPDLSSLNAPNTKCILKVNATATVSIDPTCATPTINTLEEHSDLYIYFSNFVNSKNVSLDPNLVEMFNQGMSTLNKKSVIPSKVIDFLANYAAIGLQAAQINCPK